VNPNNDTVEVYKDAAGKWRWRRFDGHNGLITSESGQGYIRLDHAISMAEKMNGIMPYMSEGDE
jgi:uncharacterized protein YegP (UPF0339 family)